MVHLLLIMRHVNKDFSLYFYPEKSLNDPYASTSSLNSMYLICVTLKSYNHDMNIYIYIINGWDDNIYNTGQGIVKEMKNILIIQVLLILMVLNIEFVKIWLQEYKSI